KRSLNTRSPSVAYCGFLGAALRFVNAIHLLSGLKIGTPSTPRIWNGASASRSARRNQIDRASLSAPPLLPRCLTEYASRRPSGLQRGADTLNDGSVNRRGAAVASAATSQSSFWRRFSASTIVVLTKATPRPSGDTAGACTPTT